MIQLIKKIWQNRDGNVIVIVGAALPVLIGCAGLATDTIQWTLWKRQLQRAADSAAIAGVYTRSVTDTQTAVEASVCNDLAKNQNTGMALTGTYVTCPDGTTRRGTVSLLADNGFATKRVQVALTVSRSLPFSSFFVTAPDITANATAATVPGVDEYCVVALENTASQSGITIGGNANIDMDCGMISDSPATNSALANGTSRRSRRPSLQRSVPSRRRAPGRSPAIPLTPRRLSTPSSTYRFRRRAVAGRSRLQTTLISPTRQHTRPVRRSVTTPT